MMKMKISTVILLLLLLVFSWLSPPAQAQKSQNRQDMRILYVGGSANWMDDYGYSYFDSEEEKEKNIQRRMESFENMLNGYFQNVTVMRAQNYKQRMSYDYHVTIMDGTPPPIDEKKIIQDSEGNFVSQTPAIYLTEDFDKPMLFIGQLGATLGRSIGLKTDWYCLCLDARALNFDREHPIFNRPFSVNMAINERPTPESAFHYQFYMDEKIPQTIPMWRVQTKGYKTDEGFRIGMVARPWGFEDSPDAEAISGGVNSKTLDAVAIGRHGNYFHWGFAASPKYMTDEAKTVLANAVYYISKFDGKGVIARKYQERRATREYLKALKYRSTRRAYEARIEMMEEFDTKMLAEKEKAQQKQANGEELTASEERALNYQKQSKSTFEEYVKRYQPDNLFARFGTDAEAYRDYYNTNRDYFYGKEASYEFMVDEEVKSLSVSNYDKRLLDKAITMLDNGNDVAKAERILDRYTLVDFEEPAEWRAWYEKNNDQMFFTETGGYNFMINTYDGSVPGNNYHYLKKKTSDLYEDIKTGKTNDEKPVRIATGIVNKQDGKQELVVKVNIHSGYHTYAYLPEGTPFIKTEVKLDLPEGYTKIGELDKPSYEPFNDDGTTIYTGNVVFKQQISGNRGGEAVFQITYQVCNDDICLPSVRDKKYTIRLN